MEVVAEAANGKAASSVRTREAGHRRHGHLDARHERLVATRALKQQQPKVTIVALTRHEDDNVSRELLRAGHRPTC